jgi:flagellar biosynthetic protein FliR
VNEAEFLAALPDLAFRAVLLFARLGAAVMLLPGLGEAELPASIRLGLGLALVALLLPGLQAALPPAPDSTLLAGRLLVVEVLVGLWIGGLARLVMLALGIAAQIMSAAMGLASVIVQDPSLGAGGTALSRLLGLVGVVLVLATGLYTLPLQALAESYRLLPPGEGFPVGQAAETMVAAGAASLALALRLAAPFLLAAVVANIGLGLLARVAPAVQIYFVAVPGQILAGLLLLGLLAPALLASFRPAAEAAFTALPGNG